MHGFPFPFPTPEITVSMLWHPRLYVDPAHQWLRGLVLDTCAAMKVIPAIRPSRQPAR
jgi:DNA-binding transcriptional LysR family regulator